MPNFIHLEQLAIKDISLYVDHLANHMGASGIDSIIYSPFDTGHHHDKEQMTEKIKTRLFKSLDTPDWDWERAFVAKEKEKIIGHVDLKGTQLKTSNHRCQLGMGLDPEYRFQGIGKKLILNAIEWVTEHTSLNWIDLYVFAHNTPAIKLYKKVGFKLVGQNYDLFRIDNKKITDYHMTLKINRMNNNQIQILPMKTEHLEETSAINIAAWKVAYEHILPTSFLETLDMKKSYVNWSKGLYEMPEIIRLVALRSEKVLGYVVGLKNRTPELSFCEGELFAIYVHPDHFQQNIGKELFNAFKEELSLRKMTSFCLWTFENNHKARSFYEKLDGKLSSAKKNFTLEGIDYPEVCYEFNL